MCLKSNQEHTCERDCLRCAIWALWPVRSCSETICLSFSFSIAMLLKADFKRECTKQKEKRKQVVFSVTELHIDIYYNISAIKTECEISIPQLGKFETRIWTSSDPCPNKYKHLELEVVMCILYVHTYVIWAYSWCWTYRQMCVWKTCAQCVFFSLCFFIFLFRVTKNQFC